MSTTKIEDAAELERLILGWLSRKTDDRFTRVRAALLVIIAEIDGIERDGSLRELLNLKALLPLSAKAFGHKPIALEVAIQKRIRANPPAAMSEMLDMLAAADARVPGSFEKAIFEVLGRGK